MQISTTVVRDLQRQLWGVLFLDEYNDGYSVRNAARFEVLKMQRLQS